MKKYLELIKFEHTIFALPFALMAMFVLSDGWPSGWKVTWIIIAMVSARTAAMTANRIFDFKYDRINPRTKKWPLVTGEVTLKQAWWMLVISIIIFLISAGLLNLLALYCAPFVLLVLCGYSLTKRFTSLSHFVLGLSLGLAPMGVGVALEAQFVWPLLWLTFAVLCWVAGFDIIYSCQDEDFDRKTGLYSIVVRFGIVKALIISNILHIITVLCLVIFGIFYHLSWWYYLGVLVVSIVLFIEHKIISPKDMSKVNAAFFTANGFVGIALLIFTILDVFNI